MTRLVNLKYKYDDSKGSDLILRNEEISREKTLECNICGKNFFRKASLTVHVNSHTTASCNTDDEKSNDCREKQNTCNVCFKKFTAKKNLLKHLRDVHKNFKEAERMVVKKLKCPEKNCKFICRMMKELRDHIEKCHKIKILKDTLQFSNEMEFQKWKKEEETNTVSWFVTGRRKTTLIDGSKKQILCCHRTGHYNPKGFGKYRMRSVGSCKIGVTCPAAMEITEFTDGQLTVVYYKTHLGHIQDVVYLKLSREEKADLAEKIEQGFTLDAIIEDVKESNCNKDTKKKRIHLLSKKDLYSIMRTANNNINGKKTRKEPEEKGINEPIQVTEEARITQSERITGSDESFLGPAHNVAFSQNPAVEENSAVLCCQKLLDASIPQPSGEGIASQIVIFSPEIDYSSVAEIILLSTGEGAIQQSPIQKKIQQQEISQSPHLIHSDKESHLMEMSLEEKNRINRLNLRIQLKEKIERISEFLPKTELLTPKQFDAVNAKLDGILSIFEAAGAKAKNKRQSWRKRFGNTVNDGEDWRRSEEIQGDGDGRVEEGNLVQPLYGSPLVYAVYN